MFDQGKEILIDIISFGVLIVNIYKMIAKDIQC